MNKRLAKIALAIGAWHVRRAEFWHDVAEAFLTGQSLSVVRELKERE